MDRIGLYAPAGATMGWNPESVNTVTTESVDSSAATSTYDYFNSPAAELILSNRMHDSLRGVTMSARTKMAGVNGSDSIRYSKMIERCNALNAKFSDGNISEGQRNYIQTEIERIKREVTVLNIAI